LPLRAEERFFVPAEQEGETGQVVTQLADAVGGVADELCQRGGQPGRVAVQPADQELQHFGEFRGVGGVRSYLGHEGSRPSWMRWARVRLSVALAL
jgi:hypothetical protein